MEGREEVEKSSTGGRRTVAGIVRKHLFLTAFVVLALLGGAIRLLPTSIAAAAGSGSSASTACSAK
jgi:hypothetical protein